MKNCVKTYELIDRVRANMDEWMPMDNDKIQSLGEDFSIERFIRLKIPEAITHVFKSYPSISILPTKSFAPTDTGNSFLKSEDGSGTIVLPDDILRLVCFKMKEWEKTVYEFIEPGSPLFNLQKNPYTRAGVKHPVCTLDRNENGETILCYYSVSSQQGEHKIERALYVPMPIENQETEEYDIPLFLIPNVCYTCAAMVYEIFKEADIAAIMQNRATF